MDGMKSVRPRPRPSKDICSYKYWIIGDPVAYHPRRLAQTHLQSYWRFFWAAVSTFRMRPARQSCNRPSPSRHDHRQKHVRKTEWRRPPIQLDWQLMLLLLTSRASTIWARDSIFFNLYEYSSSRKWRVCSHRYDREKKFVFVGYRWELFD